MSKFILQTRVQDTLATTMAAGASTCTLTSGNFGSPTGKQIITLDYDVAAKAADFLCTIAGTAVTAMTRLNGPDVEHSSAAKVAMNFVDEHYSLLMDTLNDGWLDPKETWVYASATTITVPSGAASRYSVGDKIKLTQTTVKYFYVTAVADTVLTVTGGTDYTVANAAITANYYSKLTSPVGFPQWFATTTTFYKADVTTDCAGTLALYRFCINGRKVFCKIDASAIADPTGIKIYFSLPVTAVNLDTYSVVGEGECNAKGGGMFMVYAATPTKGTVFQQTEGAMAGSGNSFHGTFNYEI